MFNINKESFSCTKITHYFANGERKKEKITFFNKKTIITFHTFQLLLVFLHFE